MSRSLTLDHLSFVASLTRSSRCKSGYFLSYTVGPDALTYSIYASHSTGRDELLETAMALHDVAMKDEYFVSRKLAPNVDFWR